MPRKNVLVPFLAALLGALALANYALVARNGFLNLDDNYFIYSNTQVRQGLNAQTILWAVTSTEYCNWFPLTRLTHLADVSLFDLWAGGHHLASVAWHAAAAVLLFVALRLMTGGMWRSLVVAALFAVHPLNVESVAWAAERSMVLAGFFFALTLLLWTRYARRPDHLRYLAALCAYAAGLLAKPVLVSLPFLLLLLDVWPLCRLTGNGRNCWRVTATEFRSRFREKIPFFVLALASSILTLGIQRQGGALQPLDNMPLWVRLGNTPLSYWHYLGKIFWPDSLAVFHPHPSAALPLGRAVLAGLLLVAMTGLVLMLARRRPWLGVGWLWYLGTLVPMIGLVQVGDQALAERYAYLPSIGIFIVLVWAAAHALPAGNHRGLWLGAGAGAIVLALSAVTAAYVVLWKDGVALFTHALKTTQHSAKLEHLVGNALLRQGSGAEAISHYREALRLDPEDVIAHLNISQALSESGRTSEAEAHYRQALWLQPQNAEAHNDLGFLLSQLGRPREAEAQFREALRWKPGQAVVYNNLGVVLQESGRTAEAEEHYREALRLRPRYASAHSNLAVLLARRGLLQEAEAHVRAAERLRGSP